MKKKKRKEEKTKQSELMSDQTETSLISLFLALSTNNVPSRTPACMPPGARPGAAAALVARRRRPFVAFFVAFYF